jgi:hypothetical protein
MQEEKEIEPQFLNHSLIQIHCGVKFHERSFIGQPPFTACSQSMSGEPEGSAPPAEADAEAPEGWSVVKARLLAQAPEAEPNQSLKLDFYFNSVQNYKEAGRKQIERRDYERAYIYLMRFANVVVYTIPKHKDYKLEKYKRDKKRVKIQLENVLETIEKLTDRLQDKYDNPKQQDFEEDDAAAVAAATAGVAALAVSETKEDVAAVADASAAIAADASKLAIPDSERWANLRVPSPVAAPANAPRASASSVKKVVERALTLQRIKVPLDLMDQFLRIAYPNTKKDVETCGILGGTLVGDHYQVTHVCVNFIAFLPDDFLSVDHSKTRRNFKHCCHVR